MKKIDLALSRKLQYDLLKELHNFCESNGIHYMLAFGTLIGAIRHKGYIPWDDDTDVMMPRPDFEKFKKLYKPNDHFYLSTYEDNSGHYFQFGRLYNKNTFYLRGNTEFPGICIDVYIIDGVPNDSKIRNNFLKKVKYYRDKEIRLLKYYMGFSNHSLHFLVNIIYPFLMKNCRRFHEVISTYKYEKSDFVAPLCTAEGPVTSRKVIDNTILVPFEDGLFRVPSEYDTWLKQFYGDYMKLPPIEKRKPYHGANFYLR